MNWKGKSNNSLSWCSSARLRKHKCPLWKTLSHHCFRLLTLLHLPKMMILMTLFLFCQKVSSQAQHHNAYTITPLHVLIVGIVLPSYDHCRRRHHQWSLQQEEEWRSQFDWKTWFLLLMQCYDGKAWFLLFCHPLNCTVPVVFFFIALLSFED